jgi:hypothetical protein
LVGWLVGCRLVAHASIQPKMKHFKMSEGHVMGNACHRPRFRSSHKFIEIDRAGGSIFDFCLRGEGSISMMHAARSASRSVRHQSWRSLRRLRQPLASSLISCFELPTVSPCCPRGTWRLLRHSWGRPRSQHSQALQHRLTVLVGGVNLSLGGTFGELQGSRLFLDEALADSN